MRYLPSCKSERPTDFCTTVLIRQSLFFLRSSISHKKTSNIKQLPHENSIHNDIAMRKEPPQKVFKNVTFNLIKGKKARRTRHRIALPRLS